MARPTIRDVAAAAEVSVATVNRVLSNASGVKPATMQRVLAAAKDIGFYGVGAIKSRIDAARPQHHFTVVVQTPHKPFAHALARGLENAAQAAEGCEVRLRIEQIDDLSPERVATRMLELGADSEAMAVVAAEHPIVTDAIDRLGADGVPVIALVSQLLARNTAGYVGLDNWKVGRMAAWAFEHMCRSPGKLGILVGTHRYRCHDLRESGFRSYMREHANNFTLLEPLSTFESEAIAREMTEKLLQAHSDLQGIYVSGGGIAGVLAALRDSGRSRQIITVGYDLTDVTKVGLMDRSLTLVFSHPFELLGRETIQAMIRAKKAPPDTAAQSMFVPFDIYTRENI